VTHGPTIVVSDAHLGYGPPELAAGFHRFLEAVADMGDHLVINGDLFEFWFEYHSVIPRLAFPTLAQLAALRSRGVRLTVIGGNHDRWGGRFWSNEMDAAFYPRSTDIPLSGHRCFIAHGDALSETRRSARAFHRIIGHPVTTSLFRWIHPDIGMAIVRRLSPHLAGKRQSPADLEHAAQAQQQFAFDLLGTRTDIDMVILAHTHVRVVAEFQSTRWFVNPGAWHDGGYYAVLDHHGPTLHRFTASS
jgi:UDP-2,3-diacylglucosamine hydrolase